MKTEFSYRALLSLHPYSGESTPSRITCPSCGTVLRVTATTRLISWCLVVGLPLATLFVLAWLPVLFKDWQVALAVLAVFSIYHFAAWPCIVRLKPWTPFEYWLPKRRVVGYMVYLLAPLSLMAIIFYLAITTGSDP